MNIYVTPKIIKEMCGTVSFKKGDSFVRADKVTIETYSPDRCVATVRGVEDFCVTIEKASNGSIDAKCSCPKLTSFQKACQHIAAVLLAIYNQERHGTNPMTENEPKTPSDDALTEGLLTLFQNQPTRSSKEQLYFEKRRVLKTEFICTPVSVGNGQYMFAIEMTIDNTPVPNLREFLKRMNEMKTSLDSTVFTFDPALHCFQKDVHDVLMELIVIENDERGTVEEAADLSIGASNPERVFVPPSSWTRLVPLLKKAPNVKLKDSSNVYDGLLFYHENEVLPLRFHLDEGDNNGFELKIEGMKQLIVLRSYQTVFVAGKLMELKSEECQRLSDLKEMLTSSGTNKIPIQKAQIHFFLEKVVPGFKKLGIVQISKTITERLINKPLVAKLYLDRLKNRLLAGLEFHYDNIVINPLEHGDGQKSAMIVRDVAKEEAILKLMEESGFAKTEGGYSLQNEELEYEFLYYIFPKLQNLVLIYATTAVKIRLYKGSSPPQIKVKLKKDRINWLEFKFEIDPIPEAQIREVLAALEEKRKYYRLNNGALLSLETKEFQDMKRFLSNVSNEALDFEQSFKVPIVRGLRLLDSSLSEQLFTFEESFRTFVDHLHNPGSLSFPVPSSLTTVLRDYQKQGYQWLKALAHFGFGGILADDMGLGKTLQSITFIVSELDNIREKKLPVLIVCPSSLTYNWFSELMKFSPEVETIVVDGTKIERKKLLKDLTDIDVVIISYPLLRKDISDLEKQAFHTVFYDEAQAFKNPVTQTARAVKKIKAKHCFALTGTPVENSLVELWSIFHVVFPELFLGLKEYSNLTKAVIARRTSLFLLRRLKEDVLGELPNKKETTERIILLPEQKHLYTAYLAKLKHETLKHLDKDTLRKNRIKILAGLTRLRQICCHPSLFVEGFQGSSAKFEALLKIIEEGTFSGRRILIFSQFTKMLELIGRQLSLEEKSYFYLDGHTPSAERVAMCDRFNKGERDLFLISLKAGGTGLNLTGADTVILYDIWWNPAVEQQAADRAHRIGQTNSVQVIKLVAYGTIEEKINDLQEKKRQLIEEIIDPKESFSSSLTEEDIREILML